MNTIIRSRICMYPRAAPAAHNPPQPPPPSAAPHTGTKTGNSDSPARNSSRTDTAYVAPYRLGVPRKPRIGPFRSVPPPCFTSPPHGSRPFPVLFPHRRRHRHRHISPDTPTPTLTLTLTRPQPQPQPQPQPHPPPSQRPVPPRPVPPRNRPAPQPPTMQSLLAGLLLLAASASPGAEARTTVATLEIGRGGAVRSTTASSASDPTPTTVDGIASFWSSLHPRDGRRGRTMQWPGMAAVPDLFRSTDGGIVVMVDLRAPPSSSSGGGGPWQDPSPGSRPSWTGGRPPGCTRWQDRGGRT